MSQMIDTKKVTRVEVIDHREITANDFADRGRVLVRWDNEMSLELHLQDSGKTLKVFLKDRK